VPCGVAEERYGVTSLADLGLTTTMAELDVALRWEFEALFGATADQAVGSDENRSPGRRSAKSSSVPSR
jgi:lipoyl(octanoyl) transferase